MKFVQIKDEHKNDVVINYPNKTAAQIGDRLIYTMKLDFTKETGAYSFWERMSDGMTNWFVVEGTVPEIYIV